VAQSGCRAQTKLGRPCAAFALTGGGYCWNHDPERAGDVRQARAKGGAAASKLRALRGRRSKLDTVPALVAFTAGVIQDTLVGGLAPDVARVVLYGLSIQRQLVEAGDLDRRLSELEAQLGAEGPERRAW
jgi:hypothetical protein